MPIRTKNSRVLFFVKLGVSLGLLSYLVWIIDWERAIVTLDQADKFLLLTIPFCMLAGLCIASSRWLIVLADSKVQFSFKQAYKGYLLGMFYSIFLPGVIGGDAVRIVLCAKQTKCKMGTATSSVLLERAAGVFALLSFFIFIYFLFPTFLSSPALIEYASFVRLLAAIIIITIVIGMMGRHLLVRWLPKEATHGLWPFVHSGILVLANLRGRTLGIVFMLSALFQSTDIVATFLISKAIGLTVSLPVFFAIIPIVYLATVLPISIGGLGIREGTLVVLLSQFDVVTSDAVTLSFLVYLNRIVIGGLGGLVQLLGTLIDKENTMSIREVSGKNKTCISPEIHIT